MPSSHDVSSRRGAPEALFRARPLTRNAGWSRGKDIIIAACLLALLFAAVATHRPAFGRLGTDVDHQGYVAFAIGRVATLGLGIALSCLLVATRRQSRNGGTKS